MCPRHHPAAGLLIAVLLLLFPSLAQGEEKVPNSPPEVVDPAYSQVVDERIEKLKASSLSPEVIEEGLAIWADARSQASKLRVARKKIDFHTQAIEQAPQELVKTIEELAKSPTKTTEEELAPLTASETKTRKTNVEAELLTKQSQLESLVAETAMREERLKVIPGDIAALSNERPPPNADLDAEPAVSEAWEELQKVRDPQYLDDRRQAMELEQKSYSATEELLSLRKRLVQQQITHLQEEQKLLQEVSERKSSEESIAERETAVAQAKQFSDIPVLSEIAEDNAHLAREREEVLKKLGEAQALYEKMTAQLTEVKLQSQNAHKRIMLLQAAEIEIDSETGRLLRLEREELPTIPSLKAKLRKALKDSTKSQITESELVGRIATEAVDIEAEAQRLRGEFSDHPEIALGDIRELLLKRSALEADLAKDYRLHVQKLDDVIVKLQELASEVRKYSLFLDERLIWIASAPRLHVRDLAVEQLAFEQLIAGDFGKIWLSELGDSLLVNPFGWITCIILTTFLVIRRRHYRQVLKTTAEQAARRSCTSFRPTWKALLHTLLLALPIPLVLISVSRLVPTPSNIATAFLIGGIFVFLFTAFRRMSGRNGLFRNHFQMTQEHGKLLYFHLTWFLAMEPIALFLFFALSETPVEPQAGRFVFIFTMILLAVFVQAILRPKKGLIPRPRHFKRLPHLIYLIALAIPVLFILGSSFGYISSVETLRRQTMTSVWLILISVLIARLLERWILVSRRELARTQALKAYQGRLEALEKEKIRKKRSPESPHAEPLPTAEEFELKAINIVTVEDQTKKLVRAALTTFVVFGVLNIWAPSLQALSFLDRVPLWGGSEKSVIENIGTQSGLSSLGLPSAGPASDAAEPTASEPATSELAPTPKSTRSDGVSLQDLVFAVLAIFLTVLAAKNLPGLLELSLLRRLDLKPGGNYAVTTILRYAISAIGLLIAFGLIGITWSSVQWLAAAITLGIGFGLQEIFANFVAGIILLFERPIRVGDVVTVGDVSGGVTKIEMRATTIRQFNSRELIVPNKEFITGQLVNWTLSDDILRFDLMVGIAYGSDTQKASDLLTKIAHDNARVLEDPAPQILFTSFGASTLDFTLRAYISGVRDLVPTQSELHFAIDREFQKAGLEIAFPQSDIHIRSLPSGVASLSADPKPDPAS